MLRRRNVDADLLAQERAINEHRLRIRVLGLAHERLNLIDASETHDEIIISTPTFDVFALLLLQRA